MPSIARLTDIWVGICCCHPPIPCIGMSGPIVTSSVTHKTSGLGVARLGDMVIGACGHPGTIVSSSVVNKTDGLGKARVGDAVVGCMTGTIVTGDTTHITT